jgi:hypothetical protein
VRRQSLVASAVLTAALALVALPGVAGSQIRSPERPLTAEAFQSVRLPASAGGSPVVVHPLDVWSSTTGSPAQTAAPIEPGIFDAPASRLPVTQPLPLALLVQLEKPAAKNVSRPAIVAKVAAKAHKTIATATARAKAKKAAVKTKSKASKYRRILTGLASWYDNGTTAMRMPRGTRVKICGDAGCVTRTIRDWGPARYLWQRIVDLTPGDFRRVTGKRLGAGLAKVTVYIY